MKTLKGMIQKIVGSDNNAKFFCKYGDSEAQSCEYDDSLLGLKLYPGSMKRKSQEDSIRHELELSDSRFCDSIDLKDGKSNPKRSNQSLHVRSKGFAGLFSTTGFICFFIVKAVASYILFRAKGKLKHDITS